MLNILIITYLSECGLVAVLLMVILAYLRSVNTEDSRFIKDWVGSIAAGYIIFWPWRLIGFPLYMRIKGQDAGPH